MIRVFASLALGFALSGPAFATEWTRYVNTRSGVGVDLPGDYRSDGPARAGPGTRFRAANGRSAIEVWGAPLRASRFSEETGALIAADEAEGWSITYRSETPDWAAWTGTRAGHVSYTKTILVCNDTQMASVRLNYPALDIPHFDSVANRLGRSLAQDGGCF